MTSQIRFQIGMPEKLRAVAAGLYDEAFGQKFGLAIPGQAVRRRLLAASFTLPYAITALADDRLVGLAGFQTAEGSLTGGLTRHLLFETLGVASGLRAAIVFSLYERRPVPGELLMDGIAVSAGMRGRGIGTRLLDELKFMAGDRGFHTVRLDVIDTNPDARRLYERAGFVPVRTVHFGYLRWLLGFGASTTLAFSLAAPGQKSR